MSDEELEGMTDSEKLNTLIRMAKALTDKVNSLHHHMMTETDNHDKRIRKLELHVLDTEPSPAPAPTNGDAS